MTAKGQKKHVQNTFAAGYEYA